VYALDLRDLRRDPLGERDAARRDPEQDQGLTAPVALEDLVGDPGQRPGDRLGIENGPTTVC
jgi:hypothetical protein